MHHAPIFPSHDPVPARPGDERRAGGQRHKTVLLVGRIRNAVGETACLVHDISSHGLMARFPAAPGLGDRLWIAVRGLPEVAATVRWVDGFKAGVEFDAVQDIAGVFCLRDERGHVMRTPRFAMAAHAVLRAGERRMPVDVLDISPGGVKLRSDAALHQGQAGSMVLPGLDVATFGAICWTRDDRAGFRFCAPLSLASLSQVLGCG